MSLSWLLWESSSIMKVVNKSQERIQHRYYISTKHKVVWFELPDMWLSYVRLENSSDL